jgi:hypothetical protein
MFGKKSAIRKYKRKLPPELSKRYGGIGPYSQLQVERTVKDLKLSFCHISYAYLMYCDLKKLPESLYKNEPLDVMLKVITTATSGGFMASGVSGGDSGAGFDGGE